MSGGKERPSEPPPHPDARGEVDRLTGSLHKVYDDATEKAREEKLAAAVASSWADFPPPTVLDEAVDAMGGLDDLLAGTNAYDADSSIDFFRSFSSGLRKASKVFRDRASVLDGFVARIEEARRGDEGPRLPRREDYYRKDGGFVVCRACEVLGREGAKTEHASWCSVGRRERGES